MEGVLANSLCNGYWTFLNHIYLKISVFSFLLKEKVFWPHNFGYKCLTLLSDMRATVPRDPISSLNPATCYIYSHLFNYSKRFASDHEISRKVTKKVKNKKSYIAKAIFLDI